MMARNPWTDFLTMCEMNSLVCDQSRLSDESLVRFLQRHQFLSPMTPLPGASCRECGSETYGEIVWIRSPVTGETHPILPCAECGPVELAMVQLQRWRIELQQVMKFLAEYLELRGDVQQIVPKRLWQLGKAYWLGTPTTIFFGRQFQRSDLQEVLAPVSHFKNGIFLVPKRLPTVNNPQSVIPLTLLVHWNGQQLEFDQDYLLSQLPTRSIAEKRPSTSSKRDANRAAVKQRLRHELENHIRACRDHLQAAIDFGNEPELLPFPSYAELAHRCNTSKATISRCFRGDVELSKLSEISQNLNQMLSTIRSCSR